jgi:TRAP-type mannitol/chloroaromatic compound transport system permease small subunit
MHILNRICNALDALSDWSGRLLAWLTLFMVLITCLVVVLRYGFNQGSIALQEVVLYMHAAVFMLGAAYTLRRDSHVRVDIFYRRLSPRGRAWVDLFGTLCLLLPFTVLIGWLAWQYVASAWVVREGSRETGGLPCVWLLKSLILLMPVMVAMQGLSLVGRCLLTLRGNDVAGVAE